jgi:hypothetical protein
MTNSTNLTVQKLLQEAVHNLGYEKKAKYKKLGAPETIEQFEDYKQKLEEIEMLSTLEKDIEAGRFLITPPDTSDPTESNELNTSEN